MTDPWTPPKDQCWTPGCLGTRISRKKLYCQTCFDARVKGVDELIEKRKSEALDDDGSVEVPEL